MTTNTRLSIFAALVAIGILVFATVGVGLLDTRARTEPHEAVTRFYTDWIKALRDGPNAPYERELHEKSTYVTEGFARTVARAHEAGEDAVLCTGTVPGSFSVTEAQVRDGAVSTSVQFTADTIVGRAILVQDERGWWRIDEVDCPAGVPRITDDNATTTLE